MLLAIARFELAQRLKRLSTYVYFGALAILAAVWMAAAGGAFRDASVVFGSDKVLIDAPYALAQTITVLGFLGVTIVAATMGRAVQQDFEHQTFPFFFTSPISVGAYYWGRYLGALATLVLVFLGIALGIVIGIHVPAVDPTRVGALSLRGLVQPYLTNLIPNLVFLGACFFGIAALTRRMLPVYIAGVIVFIGYLLALRLLADIDNRTLAALIDPVGSSAMSTLTRYWSLDEKNRQFVPLAELLLVNRALWLAVGLGIGALCYARFRFAFAANERSKRARPGDEASDASAPALATAPRVTGDYRAAAYLRELPGLTWLYLRETVTNVYFVVIVLGGVLFLLGNVKVLGTLYGTNTYPVTYQILEFASGNFVLLIVVITAFYAGELAWRERDARLDPIQDSYPTPTWLPLAAKLLTLFVMQGVLQLVVMLCGIAIQAAMGYTRFEIGHYLYELFLLQWPGYALAAVIALTIHAVVHQKYLGHFLVVVLFVAASLLPVFGFENRLYRFGAMPETPYSDMNGYGHFVAPLRWFQLYWSGFALLLVVVASLAWVRGTESHARARLALARRRFGPGLEATAGLGLGIFVATGAWIYVNTHVFNRFANEYVRQAVRADYEKAYKSEAGRAQPKVTASRIDVEIFPREGRLEVRGRYTLANKTTTPIDELQVNVLPDTYATIELAPGVPATLVESNPSLGWFRYRLDTPLAPAAVMTLAFVLQHARHGFDNDGGPSIVLGNGTFVNSSLLPAIGYQERAELTQDSDRRKHGLAPKERMHDLDDDAARQRNYVSPDGDWIDFEARLTTDDDQTAIAPGELISETSANGRRSFVYRMGSRILNFYAFLSARYATYRGEWRHGDVQVPIVIDYQPGHEYNLATMVSAVRDSLDYYTTHFSPYQHRQVRIVEFPRYARFAQAFPNTIPYSEAIGFIARVDPDDAKDVDYPYYVTAHEVAHQWWAHQVIGADVQGATMLSETMAQYSALMVMKHKYGDAKMKRFLKYELDRYLVGRAVERKKELPLYRNENQDYVHYRKGSLAMYALQDAIGEENVNRALASYIRKVAFQEPPYTISRELLAEFRAVTPPQYASLVTDLFETITLYENRALEATWHEAPGGRAVVDLRVSARKVTADAGGAQSDTAMDDWVDIGVFDARDQPLYLRKHRVRSGESTITVDFEGVPASAGIDPVNKLIDRRPQDNVIAVKHR